ncbi:hypothetical protein [Thomasclavelia cocleata]|uniref:hypothetical protein n=1 Tax=Thomasclavelia cocleata TaxID=69824 RepID=UPI0026371EA9|nr:hypothetical protein [Thomasclavelia cocleata]
MNKYQEALDRLCENNYFDEKGNCNCDLIVMDRILMQELVDKATPKKPLKHPSYKFSFIDNIFKQQKLYICPTCRNACLVRIAPNERNENRYCYDCGQAIDWSDEDGLQ